MPGVKQVFNRENTGKTLETNEWELVRGAVWTVRIPGGSFTYSDFLSATCESDASRPEGCV